MILFRCNPNLNTKCSKTCCQTVCFDTKHPEFAELDDDGNPIVSYISEDELPKEVEGNEKS
jgi:hypothetical protein